MSQIISPQVTNYKGGNGFIVHTPGSNDLNKRSKSSSMNVRHGEGRNIPYGIFLPKLSDSNHGKPSDKPKLREILQSSCSVFFKTVNVFKDKEQWRDCLALKRHDS